MSSHLLPFEVRQIQASLTTHRARFKEGPEGKKEFKKWLSEQSKDFQDTWKEMKDKYGDQIKAASDEPAGDKVASLDDQIRLRIANRLKARSTEIRRQAELIQERAVLIAASVDGTVSDKTAGEVSSHIWQLEQGLENWLYKNLRWTELRHLDRAIGQFIQAVEAAEQRAYTDQLNRNASEVQDTIGETKSGPLTLPDNKEGLEGQFTQKDLSELLGEVGGAKKAAESITWID